MYIVWIFNGLNYVKCVGNFLGFLDVCGIDRGVVYGVVFNYGI